MHDGNALSTTQYHDLRSNGKLTEPPDTTPALSNDDPGSDSEYAEKNQEFKLPESSVPLKRTVYPVFLVLAYGAAAIYAWTIICILTYRPIGGVGYGIDQLNHAGKNLSEWHKFLKSHPRSDWQDPLKGYAFSNYLDELYNKSEEYLRAARVVQSLVSLATVPLTSAVCLQAAVVYTQRKRTSNGPTLRQSMALADKGWTDPVLIGNLIFGGWRKYSSALLILSLFVHLLGVTVSPVQQLFLSHKTIKRLSSNYEYLDATTDISDLFIHPQFNDEDQEVNSLNLRLRLKTVTTAETQTRLWSRGNATVSKEHFNWTQDSYDMPQKKSQNTLVNTTGNPDLFWSQLPSTTNTGLVQQFAPRINSTAKWENVTDGALPADCNSSSDAFYIRYMYQYYEEFGYDIEMCVPGNMSISPWKNQRSRQDFGEELYLRMNFLSSNETSSYEFNSGVWSKKLSLRTTFGYFELPNYANGGTPGPLIDGDPYPNANEIDLETIPLEKRNMVNDTSWNIYKTTDKPHSRSTGPLLSIALALFGEGSLVDAQHTALAAYAHSDVPYTGCFEMLPFFSLVNQGNDDSYGCLRAGFLEPSLHADNATEKKEADIQLLIAQYFFMFTGDSSDPLTTLPGDLLLENAFASSAFLANDIMMTDPTIGPNFPIAYVLGVDMQIPSISRAGMIFVSILLALNILCLLAIAIYSSWTPHWTVKLDSFAMMRIGASISEKVPLLATNHVERIELLDELPGWIGNQAEEGPDQKGQLCLGGARPLKETKYYAGYETDRMGESSAWKEPFRAIKRKGYSLARPWDSVQRSSQV